TYILYSLITGLLHNLSKSDLLYVNFEDERIPKQTAFLSNLLPAYVSFFGGNPKYIFLDELQVMPNWSSWLRRILDQYDCQIFVTGSSSKMGSQELPTELRGRSWEIKVNPLSWNEYLRFKQIQKKQDSNLLKFTFDEYLLWGGLPEVVLSPDDKKHEILQNYFDVMLKRDIMERYFVRKEELLKTILRLLVNSTAISVSRIYNQLKSLGINLGKDTIIKYLSYIQSSYFTGFLYYYSPKMINQLLYPRKIYLVDNGFITALSTKFSKNFGRLFENWMYGVLKTANTDIYYSKNRLGKEVDFITMKEGTTQALYQVCYDMTDFETRKREIDNLISFGQKLNCRNLNIVTGLRTAVNYKFPENISILTPDNFS
ncbi:ATP-binding protein, partial [Candidatus Microgenomates bacterium]|nr:ATP-binding protein [Candidatus Microgenomates bacterium]